MNQWLKAIVKDVVASSPDVKPKVWAQLVSARITDMAAHGDRDAQVHEASFRIDGAHKVVKQVLKQERGTIAGKVIPARYAIPTVNETGNIVTGFTLPLWWEVTWEKWERMVDDLTTQVDLLSERVEKLKTVRALRERFPWTKTPGEACKLAGIDPRAIGEL